MHLIPRWNDFHTVNIGPTRQLRRCHPERRRWKTLYLLSWNLRHYSTFGELHPSQCQNKCDLMSHPAVAWANGSKLQICEPKAFWSHRIFQTRGMFILSDLKLGSACKCSSTRRVVSSMTVVTCMLAEYTAIWTIRTSASPFVRCVWIPLLAFITSSCCSLVMNVVFACVHGLYLLAYITVLCLIFSKIPQWSAGDLIMRCWVR